MLPVPHIKLADFMRKYHSCEAVEETFFRYAMVETHPPIPDRLTRWEGGWINDEDDYFHDLAVIQVVKAWLR